jgi:hypothetical protein
VTVRTEVSGVTLAVTREHDDVVGERYMVY